MARQQLRLQVRDEAQWRILVEEGVTSLLLFAFLPGRQDRFAPVVGQPDCPTVARFEILGAQPTLSTFCDLWAKY